MPAIAKHRPVRARKTDNPVAEIKRLLNPSDGELSLLLDTGIRTVYRWLEDGPPAQYYPLIRLQELIALALKSLNEDAITEWFHEPNRALGGSIPLRLVLDPRGFDLVREELWNAAHGLPL
ncbi:MAG: DUF2384 domain-containing protein [Nitrospirae bacterium]|nr:DUF2384 domain-containing protein [Nitrospirota bacterium]